MENINGEQVATNPTTGAKVVFRGGAWVPFEAKPAAQPTQGVGEKIGNFYREDIAKPVTGAAAKGIAEIYDPAKYTDATPIDQLPPFAREIAEYVVPQTATSAAVTAGSFALPAAGAARVLGEAAGPVTRALGSRLGRTAASTALGGLAGKLTGEGGVEGALQGAASAVLPEALAAGAGVVGRHLGEGSVIRQTTKDIGSALQKTIPWVGKLEKGSDFADAFIHGRAMQNAGRLLSNVKDTLGRRAQGYGFDINVPTPKGLERQRMSFQDADKLISDLQKGMGFTLGGAEKAGMSAREARALSYEIRDRVADGLNHIKSGLGDAYLKARKQFDAAATLSQMFDKRDLIGPQGLHQPKLIDRMNEYSPDLERSLGKGTTQRLLGVLRRGFVGEGKDIESHAGRGHFGVHFPIPFPYYVRHGGSAFDPIGQVPGYIRPNAAPLEAAISNALGVARKPEHGPGAQSLDHSRAESISPVPSGTAAAADVMKDMRSGKEPEVHRDLSSGRLSMDEVNKLVAHGSKTDVTAMLDHVPLTEALDAADVASPEERKMLLPLIQDKMRKELPQQKNKTLQMNLARRFRQLQSGGVDAAQV